MHAADKVIVEPTSGVVLLVASEHATFPGGPPVCQTTLTTEGALVAAPLLAITT